MTTQESPITEAAISPAITTITPPIIPAIATPDGELPAALVTREQLAAALDRLEESFAIWRRDSSRRSKFLPQPARCPITQSLSEALENLFTITDTDQVERSAWGAVLAVDLARDMATMTIGKDDSWPFFETDDPLPFAIGKAREHLADPPAFRTESPEELHRQGVSGDQICRMMRWLREGGWPDLAKLGEELAEPGKHFRQEDFVPRAEVRRRERIAAAWRDRCEERRRKSAAANAPPAEPTPVKARKVAIETVDELIEQGVTANQIAKMKNVSVVEVEERAARMGVSLDRPGTAGMTVEEAARKSRDERDALLARQARLRLLNTYPEFGSDLDSRIAAMLDDKVSPRDIVDALRPVFGHLTFARVESIASELQKIALARQQSSTTAEFARA